MEHHRGGSLLGLPIVAVLAVPPILAEVKLREVGWADQPPGVVVGVADRDASAANGTVTATASQMRGGPVRSGGSTTLDSEAPSNRFGNVNRSGSEARSEARRKARVVFLTSQ